MVTPIGGGVFWEVSHTIAFAQIRRAVCKRQPSFLLLNWTENHDVCYKNTLNVGLEVP